MTTTEEMLQRRAPWDRFALSALSYARACRSREKRAYALHYAARLDGINVSEPDYHAYGISLMAAQAVEMRLSEMHSQTLARTRA